MGLQKASAQGQVKGNWPRPWAGMGPAPVPAIPPVSRCRAQGAGELGEVLGNLGRCWGTRGGAGEDRKVLKYSGRRWGTQEGAGEFEGLRKAMESSVHADLD